MSAAAFADQAADILRCLVAFDTTSRNSNLELIRWLETYLDEHGVPHHRVYDETGSKANLFASIGPATAGGFILSGHTDVVPVDGQHWASDPFALIERDGRLFGRGAVDMKGFLACCLAAVPQMVAQPLARPVHLAFSYDEEVGCIGVRRLIDDLAAKDVRPAACFVGEPSSMQVVTGHKGKKSIEVTVRGQACHSSIAPTGVNAVEYAARLIVFIRQIADRLAACGARDALYDIPYSTGHVGPISGGTMLNIVPELCRFQFEFRVIGEDDVDELVGEVQDYARTVLEPAMRAVAADTGIDFCEKAGFPGLETDEEDQVVALAKHFAGRNDHAKVAYGTEAGLFSVAGVPTVVVGPGSIEQAHKPDEFIERAQLETCGRFMERLIAHCRG